MGWWSTPRLGRFTPGKETRYLSYRRLGGPEGRSGRVQKISPPPVFDSGPSNPYQVAIPTELFRPTFIRYEYQNEFTGMQLDTLRYWHSQSRRSLWWRYMVLQWTTPAATACPSVKSHNDRSWCVCSRFRKTSAFKGGPRICPSLVITVLINWSHKPLHCAKLPTTWFLSSLELRALGCSFLTLAVGQWLQDKTNHWCDIVYRLQLN